MIQRIKFLRIHDEKNNLICLQYLIYSRLKNIIEHRWTARDRRCRAGKRKTIEIKIITSTRAAAVRSIFITHARGGLQSAAHPVLVDPRTHFKQNMFFFSSYNTIYYFGARGIFEK